MTDVGRVPTIYTRDVAMPRGPVASMSAADPIAVRRRALFDRVIAMSAAQLAAMERCAAMIEGPH